MKKSKYIIKHVTRYCYSDNNHYVVKVQRPVVKMLVFGLFYITIKKFFCNNKYIAEISAKTLLDNLNKPYDYE